MGNVGEFAQTPTLNNVIPEQNSKKRTKGIQGKRGKIKLTDRGPVSEPSCVCAVLTTPCLLLLSHI